jgi:hypothetical protein
MLCWHKSPKRGRLKEKCALGPFLSILVIECQHKCPCVNLCKMVDKVQIMSKGMFLDVGVSKPGGSLDRRVNCRHVPQPRWVDARRNTKGERKQPEGGRRERADPAAFVLAPRLSRVCLQ